jgi:hypothetical protein
MSWVIFPLCFAARGLGVERIGELKAIYPVLWGVLRTATGAPSDARGHKGLIAYRMWLQAVALIRHRRALELRLVALGKRAARDRDGDGLSDSHCRDF